MTILALETSTQACSAALIQDGRTVAVYRDGGDTKSNHAVLLPTYVESLLATVRSEGLRLDAVALSEGPGSYTGLRIATATAKGLCYGLNIPLLTLPTTLIIAAQMEGDERVAMIDARRDEVYTATYDADLNILSPIEAKVLEHEVKAAWFAHPVLPDAESMGLLCERGLAHRVEGTEIAYYEPFYLKEFVAAPSHVKGLK